MPSWNDILEELKDLGSPHDVIRRRYLKRLFEKTGRNTIIYYSAWLQKPGAPSLHVTDADKNGFMAAIHGLERSRGLDLILHTPGGETAATESLVEYLRAMFGNDMRAIVPQLALSAGTMIACACTEIVMGKHSSLGPIDPILFGVPAHGICEEFRRAHDEIKSDPSKVPVWQPIIAKYSPTLIGECEKAIQWSTEMTKEWLLTGMLDGDEDQVATADHILRELSDHALTKSHARHLSASRCRAMGLKVRALEDDQELQEAVLSVHHTCIHTLGATGAAKIIENHEGVAFIEVLQPVLAKGPRASEG
jgi:hypothetical protein